MGKREGQVELVTGMFCFLMVLVVLLYALRVQEYVVAGAYVEDGIAAANLASAVIDIREYGSSRNILIAEPERAFYRFRDALGYNLHLDAEGNAANEQLLVGPVEVLAYIVYNVRGESVDILTFDGKGALCEEQIAQRGSVYTPDGILVESTTIYSKVGFHVRGLFSRTIYAEKEKSVDIVR